ncbi:MAG: matrixin family metalloprotease, partial [Candidatus Anammoximicrobium sp.]|nr:matrixin family metalloprotease [Candidatus Anammoximicrobium sp.]
WTATGLTPSQAATLAGVQYAVADLGGAYLGLANPATNTIRIDDDAAMMGWALGKDEVGRTKDEAISGSSFIAHPSSLDLLTVVMHELGHLLGYAHSDVGLMAPVLAASPQRASSSIVHPSSFILHPSSRVDDVFAELGDDDTTPLIASKNGDLLAGAAIRPSDEATQAKVPRRSRLLQFQGELDAWFADLATAGGGGRGAILI